MKVVEQARVLVVDDEPALIALVEDILRADGFGRLASAMDCAGALDAVQRFAPDVLILDVALPDGDGFSLFERVRARSQAPVLFLSARDEDEARLRGLGLGADDYIAKPFLPRELTLRLRAVLRRTYLPGPALGDKPVIRLGDVSVDMNTGLVHGNGPDKALTAKEYALLMKLYENRNNIVTLDRLCRAAWQDDLYGYENTLMVHMRRLREKVEREPSNPRHVLTVRGLGYRLVLEERT